MKLSAITLKRLLTENIIEIRFRRRRFKPGWSNFRRMLCTNNRELLNSIPGKIALNFKPPTQPPKYNPDKYRLVVAWDLLWQEYRMISPEIHDVLAIMPVKTKEEQEKFWQYFREVLQGMTPEEKIGLMNG